MPPKGGAAKRRPGVAHSRSAARNVDLADRFYAMNDHEALMSAGPSAVDGGGSDAVALATACLHRFTEAFNACSASAMDAELHFPHAFLAGAEQHVWAGPGRHPAGLFDALRSEGWAFTRYDSIEPVLATAEKVHFAVGYSRCRADGSVLSEHANLWVVVRRASRWGVVWRSY